MVRSDPTRSPQTTDVCVPCHTQVKALLLDIALQCLATLERQIDAALPPRFPAAAAKPNRAALHVEARRLIRRFYGQQQAPQEGAAGTM